MAGLLSWRQDRSASLFTRIQQQNQVYTRRARTAALLASIKQNLRHVLNARPGSCLSAPLLGVSDLNDATSTAADFRQALECAIRDCIFNYEPRITEVFVNAEQHEAHDPLTLYFRIQAKINFDEIDDVVEFNIHLDNQQHYHLE